MCTWCRWSASERFVWTCKMYDFEFLYFEHGVVCVHWLYDMEICTHMCINRIFTYIWIHVLFMYRCLSYWKWSGYASYYYLIIMLQIHYLCLSVYFRDVLSTNVDTDNDIYLSTITVVYERWYYWTFLFFGVLELSYVLCAVTISCSSCYVMHVKYDVDTIHVYLVKTFRMLEHWHW